MTNDESPGGAVVGEQRKTFDLEERTAKFGEEVIRFCRGLKLDAVLSGGVRIPPKKLRFSIYEGTAEANGDRALIQNLTGETGGGKITLAGSVAYGGPTTQLHLQATAPRALSEWKGAVKITTTWAR